MRKIPEEIKERLKKRLEEILEKRKEESVKEISLSESLKERIRRKLRERLSRNMSSSKLQELKERIRERLRMRLEKGRVLGKGGLGEDGRSRLSMLLIKNRLLERKLERKNELLKEAYKIVKRVDELGGIEKIERAMKLARDTIVKAGSKLFKEAVEMIASETGVDKAKVAELIKKVGLKEAKEILKKGGKTVKEGAKVVLVEGLVQTEAELPPLGMRLAKRLFEGKTIENPSDLKELGEALFKK
jgi:hypothetical protein